MANNVKARLVPKNESLIDWRKSGYVPKLGEILTATKSSNDSKSYIIVGDDSTNTQQLPAIGVADHLIPQFFNISEIKEYRNSDIDFIGFLSDQQAIHVGGQPKEVFGLFYCGKDSIESDDSTKYIHFYSNNNNNNLTFKIDDITYDESSSKYIATEIITNKTFSKNIIFSKIDSLERLIKSIEGGISFIGRSDTDPSTGTVVVNGVTITPEKGDIVYYNAIEFIYDGSSWVELGDPSGLQQQINDLASSININKTNIDTINNNITNINQNITTLEEKIDNIDIDVDFNIEYGDELPTTGEEGDIYLLNSSGGGGGDDPGIVDDGTYVRTIKDAVFEDKYVKGINYTTGGSSLETYRNQTNYAAPVGFVKEYVAEYVDTQLNAIETLLEKI